MTCYDCEYYDVCPAADPDSEPWDERRYDCSWRIDWIKDDAKREREQERYDRYRAQKKELTK